jgi:hypothetical protein
VALVAAVGHEGSCLLLWLVDDLRLGVGTLERK